LVLFSSRCGFGGGSVDLPVSDEDDEEFMDDSEEEGGGGSLKKKAKQHVEQLKRLQQKGSSLSPPVSLRCQLSGI